MNRQAVQPIGELFKRITAAEPTDEKDQTKEPPSSEKITAWSYDMQEHAEKSEERCCELANQTASSLQLVATPCIDDHSQPGYLLNRRVFCHDSVACGHTTVLTTRTSYYMRCECHSISVLMSFLFMK